MCKIPLGPHNSALPITDTQPQQPQRSSCASSDSRFSPVWEGMQCRDGALSSSLFASFILPSCLPFSWEKYKNNLIIPGPHPVICRMKSPTHHWPLPPPHHTRAPVNVFTDPPLSDPTLLQPCGLTSTAFALHSYSFPPDGVWLLCAVPTVSPACISVAP